MQKGYNVIDNENVVLQPNNIDNVNDKYDKSKSVEVIADRLLQTLGCKVESRPFMCKVAWKLSEARIWSNVEQAQKGNNPMGLFIYLCKRDGV